MWLLFWLYTAVIFGIFLSPLWPPSLWWLANFLQIVPLWSFGIPLFIFGLWMVLARDGKVIGAVLAVVALWIFGIMGFQLPPPRFVDGQPEHEVRVMTLNLGEGVEPDVLADYWVMIRPDIIVFQEVDSRLQSALRKALPGTGWHTHFGGHLGIASRYPIRAAEMKDRRVLKGWGGIAARYVLEAPFADLTVFALHLETPRDGVLALMHQRTGGIDEMQRVTAKQEAEARIASEWAATSTPPVIVAGDFNMLDRNPIYRVYWGKFHNAFAKAGWGFGYTKYTSWFGARIDHILYDPSWRVAEAWTGPDVGGDHRPLTAVLFYMGEPRPEQAVENPPATATSVLSSEKTFWEDTFEVAPDAWKTLGTGALALDPVQPYQGNSALRIEMTTGGSRAVSGVSWEHWPIETYPMLKFAYRIPQDVPVSLRVRTSFGDWICAGFTAETACEDAPHAGGATFVADGAWHEAAIDVRALVQSRLQSVNGVQSIGFVLSGNAAGQDRVWIDDIRITGGQ